MTYQPHTWTKGETITAQLLQNMDNGVAAAIDALESAFGSNYTMGSKEYKVNFTDLGKDISANAIQGTTLTATEAISGGTISGTTLTATATEGTGLTVSGDTNLQGTLIIGTDNTAVDTTIKGKLIVNGKYDNSSPAVREAATLEGKVNITGDTVVNGNIIVGDTTTNNSIKNKIYGTTTLFGKLEVQSNGSLTVDGNSFINSNFYHQINQVQENDGSTTWFPDSVFYAYYKTIDLGMKGEMISADQPRERIVSEENSSTINLAGTRLNISNTTTKISSSTTEIRGNLIIGDDPTNNIYTHTVTIKANSTLNGVTTIRKLDQLIVGDSTTTADNEIYGFTTISNLTASQLVVGTAADEENEQAATGSTILYGTTNTDNLTVGKATVNNDTTTYNGTTTFNTTANMLHGETSIDNLIVDAITLNTGIHISQYASGTNSYGLIVDKPSLIYGDVKLGTDTNNIHIRKLNKTSTNIIQLYIAANSDANETFETELNGLLRINKNLVSRKDTILGNENSNAHCDALCSGLCTGSCVTYCTGGCSEACTAACSNDCGQGCMGTCTSACSGACGHTNQNSPSSIIKPSTPPSYDILRYTGTALFNTETTTIHGNTEIDNLTIKDNLVVTDGENPLTLSMADLQNLKSSLTNNLTFTDGTDTVTLTIAELQELKNLLSESNGGE